MRVLITGGAGFIGSNLARRLMRQGHEVTALDDLSLGRSGNLPEATPLVVGDVAEAETWSRVPSADAVVHLAGASSAPMFPGRLPECFQNNVTGFIRVLDWAREVGAQRVAYASTSSIYGNVVPPLAEDGPTDIPNFYAVSKFCMEQIARMYHLQYGLETVGFRFMSVYGPCEEHKGTYANLVSQFIWELEAGRSPTVYGDGSQTRDFTNVADICAAIQRSLEHPEPLGAAVFNVGSGGATSVNDLVALLREMMATSVPAQFIPNPVGRGYVQEQLADLSRIRAVLGYEPSVTLRQGVADILASRGGAREEAPPREMVA